MTSIMPSWKSTFVPAVLLYSLYNITLYDCFVKRKDTILTTMPDVKNPIEKVEHVRASLSEVLLAHCNQARVIYLASVDFSYLPLAINLYETSFKKLQIKNYLFVCSDTDAFQILQQRGINSFDYIQDKDSKTLTNYGTAAYKRKTHYKTKAILDALLLGLTVIIIDVDIVLFKDPLPYLNCSYCDIQIQRGVFGKNTGFYMARPTSANTVLLTKAWDIAREKGEMLMDQDVLNPLMDIMSKEGKLKIRMLPSNLFPTGNVYFEDKHHMFYTDNPPRDEVLMHNNWISTKAAKIYRLKEHLQWMVDIDGYYSNPQRKYLTYNNNGYGPRANDTDALKTALLIAHLLNRTVILPTFNCANCQDKACRLKSHRCAFYTNYRVDAFDACYENQYREHVFLRNPLVPKSVLGGSDIFLIQPSNGRTWTSSQKVKVLHPREHKGPTETEIFQWFSTVRAPVLQFHSLYNIYDNFNDKSYIHDKAFDTNTNAKLSGPITC